MFIHTICDLKSHKRKLEYETYFELQLSILFYAFKTSSHRATRVSDFYSECY